MCGTQCEKRCTACYTVYYCDTQCQKSDWTSHKSKCKATLKNYKEIVHYNHVDGSINTDFTKDSPEYQEIHSNIDILNGCFKAKVQIPLESSGVVYSEEKTLLVYNKDKSFYININNKDELYPTLYKTIREHGVFGDKGFFNIIIDEKEGAKRIRLNPTLLPPELW